jgi:hypothetical protein
MSKVRLMLGGLKSFLPRARSYSMSSHVVDVRYGYSVWLRHLVSLADCGVNGPFSTVVELGPGNSVATGICAVLSGAERYIGLDVLRHLALGGERALEELYVMFRDAAPIPADSTFSALRPKLQNYTFPEWLSRAGIDEGKIDRLRHDLRLLAAGDDGGTTLRYIVPWNSATLPSESVDVVISQAVLQEIAHGPHSALLAAIAATSRWLRVGGIASHEVDFGLYGMTPWNVHWSWSERVWSIVRGRRDNFVNREPLSTYVSVFLDCGFSIIAIHAEEDKGIEDSALAPRFRSLPETERRTRTAHIVVRKEK